MKRKSIEVFITEKDFREPFDYTDNSDCPLHRAIRKRLKISKHLVLVYPLFALIATKSFNSSSYHISPNGFCCVECDRLAKRAKQGKKFSVKKTLIPECV